MTKQVRYLIEESCEHGYFGKHVVDYDPAGDTYCLTKPMIVEGEKVWWCEVHNAESVNNYDPPGDQIACWLYPDLEDKPGGTCRMVERILLPSPQTPGAYDSIPKFIWTPGDM